MALNVISMSYLKVIIMSKKLSFDSKSHTFMLIFSDVTVPTWSKPKYLSENDCLNMGTPLTDIVRRTSNCDLRYFDNRNSKQPVYPQGTQTPTVYML